MTVRPGKRSAALAHCALAALMLSLLLPAGDAFAQAKGRKRAGKPAASRKAKAGKARPSRKAKGKRPRSKPRPGKPAKDNRNVKVFDFTGLDLAGRLRTPQLIYFLDRAAQELELASLEKRSFIPEMVESVDEDSL